MKRLLLLVLIGTSSLWAGEQVEVGANPQVLADEPTKPVSEQENLNTEQFKEEQKEKDSTPMGSNNSMERPGGVPRFTPSVLDSISDPDQPPIISDNTINTTNVANPTTEGQTESEMQEKNTINELSGRSKSPLRRMHDLWTIITTRGGTEQVKIRDLEDQEIVLDNELKKDPENTEIKLQLKSVRESIVEALISKRAKLDYLHLDSFNGLKRFTGDFTGKSYTVGYYDYYGRRIDKVTDDINEYHKKLRINPDKYKKGGTSFN